MSVSHQSNSVACDSQAEHPSIPLVDLEGLKSAHSQTAQQAGEAQVDAFKTFGFAYARNHGLPQETVDAAFQWVFSPDSCLCMISQLTIPSRAPSSSRCPRQRRKKVTQMVFDADEISERRKMPDFKESYEISRENDDHLSNIWIPDESLPGFRVFFNSFYKDFYGLSGY
ncbi:hypothetical protein ColLi_09139 [Colletotrichum liriopes]|uniref:Non-haem dioxygenase N-terminal domain-containing protein n=1 Tax=Colletotrichum liriopes TaxID=708192 RepID=A0AA37GTW0_9PEZI|nr:hypothetical protein ColLi_09139 [Colletotrichum liriopes]